MTEELKVVLRRSEHSGFGFSLLGTTGPPHVIYDIVENSPAADCGAVEAGDVILKVNGTDVHRYTTKEVLKCLRLSDDLVTLELKRDPKLKARIKEQLANTTSPHYMDMQTQNIYDYKSINTSSPTQYGLHHHDAHNISSPNSPNASSPALRYKSPTHSSHRQANVITPPASASPTFGNHSRNSSTSSAKIQANEANASNATAAGTSATTSPTCRPSRIPTALKCNQKQQQQQSPQHKRPRPSQIPTKTSPGSSPANGTTTSVTTTMATSMTSPNALQHSNSYGGTSNRQQQQQQQHPQTQQKEHDSDPISAPPQPTKTPRFEAFMMTGDLILNLSKTPQSGNILAAHAKKVDSLRDSTIRTTRANGALAPRASGESSPTSSSSIESPTHTSSGSVHVQKQQGEHNASKPSRQQQQPQSANNTYNNSNSHQQHHKDSLTNDTLMACEELEKDDDYSNRKHHHRHRQRQRNCDQQQQEQQHLPEHHYEHYTQERDLEIADEHEAHEENEEDQTNYDITNIDTYNSGGVADNDDGDEASDRQCLVTNYDDDDDEEEEFSTSVTSASAKHRLIALKQQKQSTKRHRYVASGGSDSVDYVRHHHYHNQHRHYMTQGSGSSSSSVTVRSDAIGVNTSQDETSFSVPTSPTSLSTPLIDKETANSMPTSPEPSNLGGVAVGGAGVGHEAAGVMRRHNGVVRKCDSSGFRTSKSEDHLQQVQREGIAAVIPIDIDEDVNSSLNTLLDTRHDSEDSQGSDHDRIVWTYNAPLPPHMLHQQQQQQHHQQYSTQYGGHNSSPNSNSHTHSHSHSHSHSSSISSSPQHSAGSPASPTSVSSSVMSSSGSKGAIGNNNGHHHPQQLHQQQHHQQQSQNNTNGAMAAGTAEGGNGNQTIGLLQCPIKNNGGGGGSSINMPGGDQSVSEAISNISSPDYQDDDNLLSSRDILGGMAVSDPSDSDSTILVSDAAVAQRQHQQQQQQQQRQQQQQPQQQLHREHKLVIQVRGIEGSSNSGSARSVYSTDRKDSEDELQTSTTTETATTAVAAPTMAGSAYGAGDDGRDSSPPVSDDGSDVESLHSYHYSPKAVDMPSAIRLAKRLYSLDGFKKSDVSRHLSKNNDFSRAVADEYLKYFNFEKKTLDQSLREFLQQFALSGETQERERVLVHFSKRFLDCNPGTFNSQDAVHTLTCAIMLLNTDLHGQNIGRKMTCSEFIENLADLNDGENYPKDVLKYLYQAIKSQPLEWALDDDVGALQNQRTENNIGAGSQGGQNPFLDLPESATAVEYKKGYVMRKCCYDSNYKKTPFGKRSWKMFYCTLRDLVLFLHKDEHGFRKNQMSDNLHNAIRIHHALATKATDYTKKQHVFRLQTADQAEYLFQTSDSKELQSWVETINFVCAAYSAPPLEGGVGSQKRFQRPLLPSTHTKLLMKEQLESHEQQLAQLESTLLEHKKGPVPSKGLPSQNYREKENYLQYEILRYKTYVSILNVKLLADQQQQQLQQQQQQQIELQQFVNNEESDTFPLSNARLPIQQQQQQQQQLQLQANSINVNQPEQQPQPQQKQIQQLNRYNFPGGIEYNFDVVGENVANIDQQQQQQQQPQSSQKQQQQNDLG